MSDILANILTDTNNVNTLVDYTLADSGSATAAIINNNNMADASYTASAARGQMVADQTGVIAAVQNQGQLVAQTALQSYAHSLGVDPDGTISSQQAKAQDTFLDASGRAASAAANIAQKRSVSFVDDPLQWLSNKVTINDDINQFNGAANEANTAESFIEESNKLIDARAVALKNIETVTSQAAAESATKIAVAKQQELADQITRAGIAANTAGVEAVSNMSYRQIQIANARLDSDSKYLAAQNDQERLRLAQESHSMEQQRLDMEKTSKEDKLGADKYMSGQIRKGLQMMFPNSPAAWDIPDGKYQAWVSGKVPMDPRWKVAFDRASASDAAGGARVLGTSPSDAIETLQYKPTIAPSAQPTVDILTRGASMAMQTPAYKAAVASKDIKGAQEIINQQVNALVATDAMHVDSPSSLYYLPPPDKIAEMNPGLKDSAAYKTIIAPATGSGIDLANPTNVANLAVQAVKDGKISLNDAADGISNIYAQGQEHNFQAKQMFALGIVAPPSYSTNVSGVNLTGQNGQLGTVNWTDKIQVKEMLMRKSAINEEVISNPRSLISARVR